MAIGARGEPMHSVEDPDEHSGTVDIASGESSSSEREDVANSPVRETPFHSNGAGGYSERVSDQSVHQQVVLGCGDST